MKKLFLFVLSAMIICGCSDEKVPFDKPEMDISCWPRGANDMSVDFLEGEHSIEIRFVSTHHYEGQKFSWNLTGGESWCQPSTRGEQDAVSADFDRRIITFKVDKYMGTEPRKAVFTISCLDKKFFIYITQTGQNTVHVEKAGTLNEVLSDMDKSKIKALTITGNINDEDFLTIRKLGNLDYLDISTISLTTLPASGLHSMGLKKVILPQNLRTIPQSLFKNCTYLEEVTIPASVVEIKGGHDKTQCFGAFYNCKALKSINIPAGVEILESGTFSYCENLKTVIFEQDSKLHTIADGYVRSNSSVPPTSYYYGVFSYCTSLTAIDFPNELKTIGNYAFYETGVSELVFPANVETIGSSAFCGCWGLKNISFAPNSTLKTIGSYAFTGYYDQNYKYKNIPLQSVDMSACTHVESIGTKAFYADASVWAWKPLELFKIGTIIPPTCWNDTFSVIKSFSVLKVPSESIEAYKQAKGWKDFASITGLDE